MGDRLTEIRERWAVSRPAPWTRSHARNSSRAAPLAAPRNLKDARETTFAHLIGDEDVAWSMWDEATAEAIAHAPEDVAWLVASVAEAREDRDSAEATIARLQAEIGGLRSQLLAAESANGRIANRTRAEMELALGEGDLYLVTCETHDGRRWVSLQAECPYCAGPGLDDERVNVEEVVRERDAALARVAALEAVLAEPSMDEMFRLLAICEQVWIASGADYRERGAEQLRAVIADLRQRAGVVDE